MLQVWYYNFVSVEQILHFVVEFHMGFGIFS